MRNPLSTLLPSWYCWHRVDVSMVTHTAVIPIIHTYHLWTKVLTITQSIKSQTVKTNTPQDGTLPKETRSASHGQKRQMTPSSSPPPVCQTPLQQATTRVICPMTWLNHQTPTMQQRLWHSISSLSAPGLIGFPLYPITQVSSFTISPMRH